MNRILAIHCLGFALFAFSGWRARAELKVGATREEVVEVLGAPEAQVSRRGHETLYYGPNNVELAHGVVVKVDPDLEWEIKAMREKRAAAPTPQPARAVPPPAPKAAAGSASPIRKVSEGGARVNLNSLLVPGKVTVVDFYADWCGPCRRISPHLEKLAQADPEVYLLKIDIVKWGTPVTQQFGIRSVPNIRVFNRKGKELGTGTSNLALVQQRVQQAK